MPNGRKSFNDHHPELQEGEVFVSNAYTSMFEKYGFMPFEDKTFHELRLDSKRMGVVAYDSQGRVLKGAVPVFADQAEYQAKKDHLWHT